MSAEEHKKRGRGLFKTNIFGIFIGIAVFLLIVLISQTTSIFDRLEVDILDLHYKMKGRANREIIQGGVTRDDLNLKISPDILIVGIDSSTLDAFGRWPFQRSYHASFLDSLTRISNENEREASVFMDIFFINPDSNSYNDVKLINSIEDNGRVFLETVLSIAPPSISMPDVFQRQEALYERYGSLTRIEGDYSNVESFHSAEPPLIPYAQKARGYGHANFREDSDKIYRRQQLIARLSEEVEKYRFEDLYIGFDVDRSQFQHLSWQDKRGLWHDVDLPLNEQRLKELQHELESEAPRNPLDLDGNGENDDDQDGEFDNYYFKLSTFQDRFLPSITLALAADYFHKTLDDIKVVLGEYILIENPMVYDKDSQTIVPYEIMTQAPIYDDQGILVKEAEYRTLDEIKIPIDDQGRMLINFMGGRSNPGRGGVQTFPVRSFSGYAQRVPPEDPALWPPTKALANKIVMVGGFFQGFDEKTTPWGLMYGVEVHTNALNTIIMDNFLMELPEGIEYLILLAVVLLVAFLTSRFNTGWSLLAVFVYLIGYFMVADMVFFETKNLLVNYATPSIAVILTFISVVVYRVVVEESDKRHLKDMFGKYVNPMVVDKMMDEPPVLGGIDMDITVFFSDIRSFTTLSESMSPQELVALLNQYLTSMTDCMMDYTGTLDKYIGDAIMGFWGAPLAQAEHAKLACKSALKQLELLKELNEQLPEHQRIQIGIGLNSGICTVGNMGSLGRMNYTCMGDNVNLASRLEAINKTYRTELIISEFTYNKIMDDSAFICRELDDIRVKGKRKPVRIYELVGYDGSLDI